MRTFRKITLPVLALFSLSIVLSACEENQSDFADALLEETLKSPGLRSIEAQFDEATFSTLYTATAYVKGEDTPDNPIDNPSVRFEWSGPNCGEAKVVAARLNIGGPGSTATASDPNRDDVPIQADPSVRHDAVSKFLWVHPHPPCGPSKDHSDVTITVKLSNVDGVDKDTVLKCKVVGSATRTQKSGK